MLLFEKESITKDDSSVKSQARFGTIPADEFVDGMTIGFLRTRRPERVRTAFFDCSRSGSRSIVLGLECLGVFRCAILAASHAAISMVVQLETDDLEVPRAVSG